MSDEQSLKAVRNKKLEQLKERVENPSPDGQTPAEPLHIESESALTTAADDHDVLLVDFYADWCQPCAMLAPIVDEIAAETNAAVGKVDIDTHQHLATQYGVRSVPTLIIFADGDPVDRIVGVKQKSELIRRLQQYGDI